MMTIQNYPPFDIILIYSIGNIMWYHIACDYYISVYIG